jgi:sarcosine oxidase
MTYDVAVAGLGGMGSAVVAHCARRGARVIGVERFARGHELGASSGKSRMIRKAYFEDPAYVPLVTRAYELWRELEHTAGEELLQMTGVLAVGRPRSEIIAGTRRAARAHHLPIEELSRAEMTLRYPTVKLSAEEVAIFDRDAGVLKPERAIAAQLDTAERAGAELKFEAAMESWRAASDGFELVLANGERIASKTLVVALGPWIAEMLRGLGVNLRVQRNVQVWFEPRRPAYVAARFPAFLVEREDLPAPLYGFPNFGEGLKAAFHGCGDVTDADQLDREIHPARDIEPLIRAMEEWMPGAAGRVIAAKACMYAMTPDANFVVDRHPEHAGLVLCGGFSGHGFKFAPVIGEIAADLALEGGTEHEIDFLSLRRFGNGK